MVDALRQAATNHTEHMQLVQTAHEATLEYHKTAQHTRELELLKLRTQLAHYERSMTFAVANKARPNSIPVNNNTDMSNSISGSGNGISEDGRRTIEDVLTSHAKAQQERHVK
uniref:Uncharacterized protein n=1 Tax=Lygus hesperus TaxID=30085 RepID=A0A146LK75_LYGHE